MKWIPATDTTPRPSHYVPPPKKLSSLEVNALATLAKYGELLLDEDGVNYFTIHGSIPAKRLEALAERGLCRIDRVGQSTFAVHTGAAT